MEQAPKPIRMGLVTALPSRTAAKPTTFLGPQFDIAMNELFKAKAPDTTPLPDDCPPGAELHPESFDENIRSRVQEELLEVNQCLQRLINCRGADVRSWECNHLQKAVQALQKSATNSGLRALAREAASLELLLQELARDP